MDEPCEAKRESHFAKQGQIQQGTTAMAVGFHLEHGTLIFTLCGGRYMFSFLKNLFGKKAVVQSDACILVVDDSEIDRKIIETTLHKRGFQTLAAENGARGLEIAKARHPSLIVLDCEMPVMNGTQMCERLKEDRSTQDIPVLFLTSLDTPKNVVECFQMDAENFLSKPVNPTVLIKQIDLILHEFLHKKDK